MRRHARAGRDRRARSALRGSARRCRKGGLDGRYFRPALPSESGSEARLLSKERANHAERFRPLVACQQFVSVVGIRHDLAILADARAFLRQLLAELDARGAPSPERLAPWRDTIAGWSKAC